jgi:hypothetical protein
VAMIRPDGFGILIRWKYIFVVLHNDANEPGFIAQFEVWRENITFPLL